MKKNTALALGAAQGPKLQNLFYHPPQTKEKACIMHNHSDTERFLQVVFPDYGTHAIFANLNPAVHTRKVTDLDAGRDCYWSIASFPDDGSAERIKARALEVRALVIDDVGTKVAEEAVRLGLGNPTAIVETSAGNYQWTYRLEAASPGRCLEGLLCRGRAAGRPRSSTGKDAVHLFRLPMGVNTKNGFAPRLVSLNPREMFHGKFTGPVSGPGPGPSVGSGGGGSDVKLGLDELRVFMGWIPNTFGHRQEWMDVIHDIKALCEDDEDGFTVMEEWSDPEKYPGYNRVVWDKLGASGLKSTGGMLKGLAEAANPDGCRKMFAPKVFDDGAVHPVINTLAPGAVRFKLGEKKQILLTMENAGVGLDGLGIKCRYDDFHHRYLVEWRGKSGAASTVEQLTDHLVLLLRVEMTTRYGRDFGPVHTGDAIMARALANRFNPVTEMLDEAQRAWDGVARLDRLGPDYFHTEDTSLARACVRKVMIAAVRRARQPGCKFDQILVLESPEGWDKSTAWAVLAGTENFSDADILGKDARSVQEELQNIWIHEIADLSGLNRADIEHVKAFASRTDDRARGAYERHHKSQLRQCIEVGTTNSDAYLLSTTGNRRFWPFKISAPVDLVALRRDRMQLWGEAAAAEGAGETLVLDRKLWGAAALAQEDRRVVDPWEDELMNLPDMAIKDVGGGMEGVTNVAIHNHLVGGHTGGRLTGASGRKISEIMKRLGWEKARLMDAEGKEVRGYKRCTDTTAKPGMAVSSVGQNLF